MSDLVPVIITGCFALAAAIVGAVGLVWAARNHRETVASREAVVKEVATGNGKPLGETADQILKDLSFVAGSVHLHSEILAEHSNRLSEIKGNLEGIEDYHRSVAPLAEWVTKRMKEGVDE